MGMLGMHIRLARPSLAAFKTFFVMHSFGMEASPVQLQVGDPNFARVAQPAEARRRERRQCQCESDHEHQFGLQALK
jgi:hypothetical protein